MERMLDDVEEPVELELAQIQEEPAVEESERRASPLRFPQSSRPPKSSQSSRPAINLGAFKFAAILSKVLFCWSD